MRSTLKKGLALVLAFLAVVEGNPMGGGKCESSSDCVAPNVCSKWGWCQWTKIYGEDGPSQGANAPGKGRAGQCKTSADCASRVPYCSKLGYCHGGRLPFDEAQLEITGEEDAQGFINNNPAKNSPQSSSSSSNSGGRSNKPGSRRNSNRGSSSGSSRSRQQGAAGGSKSSRGNGSSACPGGNIEACIDTCVPLENVTVYGACATECGKRCSK